MPTAAFAPESPALAGLGRRLGAAIYELLMLVAIVFVAGFVALPLVTPGHAGDAAALVIPDVAHRVMLFCILFAIVAWYFTWSWTGGRRTLPMKTWGLGLRMADATPVHAKAALLRFLCACSGPAMALVAYGLLRPYGLGAQAVWLVALNFLWAFVDPQRQFLHDRLAGTRIVAQARPARAATSA